MPLSHNSPSSFTHIHLSYFSPDCSGFSTNMKDPYSHFGWNLNVLPGLPESLLRRMTDGISGISLPWLYVGMAFGTFCWHVEDNFLYSINYMHFGDGKRWLVYTVSNGRCKALLRKFSVCCAVPCRTVLSCTAMQCTVLRCTGLLID